jgi:hypothetical protein
MDVPVSLTAWHLQRTSRRWNAGMSAETVGMHMPPVVTLDDLAAMIAADLHGHRFEMSPEHAAIASRPTDHLAIRRTVPMAGQ